MKNKVFTVVALLLVGITTFAQKNPKGFSVEINDLRPDTIEIFPSVWEFYGKIEGSATLRSYAVTVNQDVIDRLPTSGLIVLDGPQIDPVNQKRLINNYRKVRKPVEDEKAEAVEDAKGGMEGVKFFSKDWFGAKADIAAAKRELQKEKRNTRHYVHELKVRLKERAGYNCIAVYNYSPPTKRKTKEEKQEEGEDEPRQKQSIKDKL